MTATAVMAQPATSPEAAAHGRVNQDAAGRAGTQDPHECVAPQGDGERAAAEAGRLVRACLAPWESDPDAPLRRLITVALDGLDSAVALRNAFVDSLNDQIDRVAPALSPQARRMVFGAQLAVLVNRHILHLGPLAEAPFERVADQVAERIAVYLS